MLASKQKQARRPSKRALEAVAEAFEEIHSYFDSIGFPESGKEVIPELAQSPSAGEAQEPEYAENELESVWDYYDDGGDLASAQVFQREDVEVSIDVFISRLVDEKIIKKNDPEEKISLAEIFQRIFGKEHEILKLVPDFEEHIEGYFGSIGYDDMKQAYAEVSAIRDIIKKEVERYGGN